MDSRHDDRALPRPGCPIRRSPDQRLLSGSPKLIAASHVLRRLLAPRHSPCALSSLTMFATGRPSCGCPDAITWVSYHALALSDGLPVQLVKDRFVSGSRKCLPTNDGSTPRSPLRSPRDRSGHRMSRTVELMGIEPTTSGLQNRRSPS